MQRQRDAELCGTSEPIDVTMALRRVEMALGSGQAVDANDARQTMRLLNEQGREVSVCTDSGRLTMRYHGLTPMTPILANSQCMALATAHACISAAS